MEQVRQLSRYHQLQSLNKNHKWLTTALFMRPTTKKTYRTMNEPPTTLISFANVRAHSFIFVIYPHLLGGDSRSEVAKSTFVRPNSLLPVGAFFLARLTTLGLIRRPEYRCLKDHEQGFHCVIGSHARSMAGFVLKRVLNWLIS